MKLLLSIYSCHVVKMKSFFSLLRQICYILSLLLNKRNKNSCNNNYSIVWISFFCFSKSLPSLFNQDIRVCWVFMKATVTLYVFMMLHFLYYSFYFFVSISSSVCYIVCHTICRNEFIWSFYIFFWFFVKENIFS